MPISGNFSLQTVQGEFGIQEIQNFSTQGLSQFHSYILTPWDDNWGSKTLRDFTGVGRPELVNSITATAPAWDTIIVNFNIENTNNFANFVNQGEGETFSTLNTEVSVDYFVGNETVSSFPSSFSTYDSIAYAITGSKSLTFTGLNRLTTYQLRLRYYNRFNKLSGPGNNFDQGVVPATGGSVGVTTPNYPALPAPTNVQFSYITDERVEITWNYASVDVNGTPSQPSSFGIELLDSIVGWTDDITLSAQTNWGTTNNPKSVIAQTKVGNVDSVRVRAIANSGWPYLNSSYQEGT
jgi:hypothetical protein